jgi:mRNA interferase MazF
MVSNAGYVPDRGHLVWLAFDPQAGHEQAGKRPALVVSPQAYNDKTGLALFCPITSQVKGYPFEVTFPTGSAVSGAVLSDQLKSLDWQVRQAEFICAAPDDVMQKVLKLVATLLRA